MPTKIFHLFPLLPTEIRINIWTLVLNTPSIIQLCFDCDDCFKDPAKDADTGWQTQLAQINRNVPPLLHTNRESRAQALKIYSDTIPGPADTYMNPEIDTICFGADTVLFPFELLYESLETHGGFDIGRLKHLAVNLNWWRTFEATFWWREYLYGSLESFTVFVEDPDDGAQRFEEIGHGDNALLWDYDHEVGVGIKRECEKERGNLEMVLEEILEDDEDSEIPEEWAVPEVKALKLRGKIRNFMTKEVAIRDGW